MVEYMIDQVIEVSAILSNRFELSQRPIELIELMEKLLHEHRGHFEEKQIQLTSDLPTSLHLQADERRLYQATEHVLNNARHYTLSGGEVHVEVEENQEFAQIQVRDTGVGIPAKEIEHVFDRMFRGSAADAGETDTRGLGLGLFISRKIVHLHDGDIQIESQPDEGTQVTMRVPLSVQTETQS
jgi:signal transduction histidine kinase